MLNALLFHIYSESDPVASQQVLESVRDTMSNYPFILGDKQNDVRIIEGKEEGAFGWVTANYLSGIFNDVCITFHLFSLQNITVR